MKTLTLTKILYVEKRESKEKNKYNRVAFLTSDNQQARLSLNPIQWQELRDNVGATLQDDTIKMNSEITLEYEDGAKTNKGKLFVDHKKGSRDGMNYDYLELSPALFITNGYITQLEFKRDMKEFF